MSTLRETVYSSVINLHRSTGKEWLHLSEIYEEVAKYKEVQNGGASIRAILETHCTLSDAFGGDEEYILKEKGSGLYKIKHYDHLKIIDTLSIGEIFTRDELMQLFKISGQKGIMKTNTLDCLVLTTSEDNEIYGDSGIENGTILYTGEGQTGDQILKGNNKSIIESNSTNTPMYLFSKDKNRKYIFEGHVVLYDTPYQVKENDINGNERLVWKFPLQVVNDDSQTNSPETEKITFEVLQIEESIPISKNNDELVFKEGPLNIRKYRRLNKTINRKTKPDYIAEEIIKNKNGIINEKVIYEYELQRLMQEEAEEQVEEMKAFFENKKENEGFDILTFELGDDNEYRKKYIEVKSTKSGESTPIDITAEEIEFCKNHQDDYYLYRVIYSDSEKRYVKIVNGKDLLKNYNHVPTTYKIYSN